MKPTVLSPKKIYRHCLFLFTGSMLLFTQCKKPEAPDRGPSWYQKEALYDFDLETDSVIREHYTQLKTQLDAGEIIRVYENLQDTSGWNYHRLFRVITDEWHRGAAGIYIAYKKSCSVGIFSNPVGTYLFAPATPYTGQELPLYRCSDEPYATNKVEAVNQIVTVPAGRFTTFSVLHDNGDRSWWNKETGIVQYETDMQVDTSRKYLRVTLKLSQIKEL